MMLIAIIILIVFCILDLTNPLRLLSGDSLYLFVIVSYWFITVWYLTKYKKSHLFCFELLFSISFFLASFLGPLLIPLLDSWHARIFIKGDEIQAKVYYICFIGYLCYMLGLIGFRKKVFASNVQQSFLTIQSFIPSRVRLSNFITLICIVLFYLKGGSEILTIYSKQIDDLNLRLGSWGEYLQYSMYAYIVSILVNFCGKNIEKDSFIKFIKSLPLLFYINTALLVIPLFLSGYRSNAIQLVIPLVLMYSLVIRVIKAKTIILMIVTGYFTLFIIGMTRFGNTFTTNEVDVVSLFQDFTAANAASTFFIDHADSHGITGGTNIVLKLSSAVPFLQSILVELFDKTSFSVDSSTVFTQTYMDTSDGGLGTSLIGDLYYSVGLIGSMLLMFFLGLIIKKANSSTNTYWILLSLVLTGNAIFAARVEYFYIIRMISFSAIILFIVLHLGRRKCMIA